MKVDESLMPITVDVVMGDNFYSDVIINKNPNYFGYTFKFRDGREFEVPDYCDRFDVYNHMSDNGQHFYTAIHVLCDDRRPEPLVDEVELTQIRNEMLPAMTDYFMVRKMAEPEDMTYLLNMLTPLWMYKRVSDEKGDINLAVDKMLKEVFYIYNREFKEEELE